MKFSVFGCLALALLCSAGATEYCTDGVSQPGKSCKEGKSLYCCFQLVEQWNEYDNARKGCEDPIQGNPQVCAEWDSDTLAHGYCVGLASVCLGFSNKDICIVRQLNLLSRGDVLLSPVLSPWSDMELRQHLTALRAGHAYLVRIPEFQVLLAKQTLAPRAAREMLVVNWSSRDSPAWWYR
ncbi:hypothetical protein BUE80_DR007597 [Diplocarpon rosae]|nr:hypothetical protein BUE80_DR007597 [Diplocarpon rosae]